MLPAADDNLPVSQTWGQACCTWTSQIHVSPTYILDQLRQLEEGYKDT